MSVRAEERLIVPLDVMTLKEAKGLLDRLGEVVKFYKIGCTLFTAAGPAAVDEVKNRGYKVFLDLKYYDIPSVVSKAVQNLVKMEVDIFTLHTLGGFELMESVVKVLWHEAHKPLALGVTILTSINEAFLRDVLGTIEVSVEEEVKRLAEMARSAGLDGVVASAHEIKRIKSICGNDFIVLAPGIRPEGSEKFDQKRVLTPKEAIENGADYIVVGRPIIQSKDPLKVAASVLKEIKEGEHVRQGN
jgi:orotidine-5'-phosphate decarboxylase